MKQSWLGWMVAAGGIVGLVLVGCDWEAGSGAETVSNRYNWVNFSGMYRAGGGGASTTAVSTVKNEKIATAVAGQSTYAGVLSHAPVVPGTLQIVAGAFVLTDNGNGVLAGSGKTGTIVYQTGAWSIDLLGAWPPAGTPIYATYQGSTGGATGPTLNSFLITQSGNTITLRDNNGAVYSGKIATIRSTGGVSSDEPSATPPQPNIGDQVIATFEAEGRSAAGVSVKIVGTLSGTVAGTAATVTSPAQIYLTNRRLQATWIEASGRTADINMTAS